MSKQQKGGMRSVAHYVVEFAVILLGISVSVFIEKNNAKEYKEQVKNQSLARILTNIRTDSLDFEFNMGVHLPAAQSCAWMMDHRNNLAAEHPDSVGKHCSMCVLGQTIFVDNQEEYRTLQNSGLMELIENDTLARALQAKYVQHEFLRKFETGVNDNANENIDVYFGSMETTPDMTYFLGYIPLKRWNGTALGTAYMERIGALENLHQMYAERMRYRLEDDIVLTQWIRAEIGKTH
ncbi:hypothetical protein N9L83_00315 [Flavobacteriales bacterium]|nr:hypothetical protein [Flavobacteriales bacterium]